METARALTEKLVSLLRREHDTLAEFLIALADFDRRRLWVDLGYSSLFYFLHRELRLSLGAAQHRKVAAELIQQVPGVVEPLRRGQLCLTSIIEVAKVVTVENWEVLLPRFYGLSRREAAEVVAELQPHPSPPVRTLVTQVRSSPKPVGEVPTPGLLPHGDARDALIAIDEALAGASFELISPSEMRRPLSARCASPATHVASAPPFPPSVRAASVESVLPTAPAALVRALASASAPSAKSAASGTGAASARPQVEVVPLTAEQSRIHLTVSKGFLKKLETATDAMSHAMPGATPAEILEAGLELLLAKMDRRRGHVEKPREQPRPSKGDGIPAHVRREVWKRDGGRCQWKLESGGICGATRSLELDHIRPRSLGGASTADNLRVSCRPHNNLAARLLLGDDLMDRYSAGLRGPARSGAVATRDGVPSASPPPPSKDSVRRGTRGRTRSPPRLRHAPPMTTPAPPRRR